MTSRAQLAKLTVFRISRSMKVSTVYMVKPMSITTAVAEVARQLSDNRLPADTLLIENTQAEVATGNPAASVSVGERFRDVLTWAKFLETPVVQLNRRDHDVVLTAEGIRDGIAWTAVGTYSKNLTASIRSRVPGITVKWERRKIGNSISSHGTISVEQLGVLISQLDALKSGA